MWGWRCWSTGEWADVTPRAAGWLWGVRLVWDTLSPPGALGRGSAMLWFCGSGLVTHCQPWEGCRATAGGSRGV